MQKPLVSVILPVYNGERYLKEALESVFGQDWRPMEVIVVDDGSTDGTRRVAETFENDVRYIYQPNSGIGAARNTGLSEATGEFITFLDHDDIWMEHKLSLQVGYLLENPDAGFVLSKIRNFLDPEASPPPRPFKDLAEGDTLRLHLGATVSRRWVFERVGGFNTDYNRAEDIDWFIRAREAGIHMAVLPEVVYKRRVHESNLSLDRDATVSGLMRAVKSSLDRKRGRNPGK